MVSNCSGELGICRLRNSEFGGAGKLLAIVCLDYCVMGSCLVEAAFGVQFCPSPTFEQSDGPTTALHSALCIFNTHRHQLLFTVEYVRESNGMQTEVFTLGARSSHRCGLFA